VVLILAKTSVSDGISAAGKCGEKGIYSNGLGFGIFGGGVLRGCERACGVVWRVLEGVSGWVLVLS
jgi:hypothetical protein